MIRFEIVADRIDYRGCDTLMFTSKQAVLSAERIDPGWKALPAVAIGPATAAKIRELGGRVLHQPADYYGKNLAEDLVRLFRERRLLYLRPEKVSFDSRSFLAAAGVELKEQVIYRTACRRYGAGEAPPAGSVIVFTSPSTIHCFLENFSWREDYRAVVIGRATLEHLPEGCEYAVAEEPSIDACVSRALAWAELM
jgi:uroporphyrinogen-III synthase